MKSTFVTPTIFEETNATAEFSCARLIETSGNRLRHTNLDVKEEYEIVSNDFLAIGYLDGTAQGSI